jgi:hypothetical protein
METGENCGDWWKPMKTDENRWRLMKTDEDWWKPMKTDENRW